MTSKAELEKKIINLIQFFEKKLYDDVIQDAKILYDNHKELSIFPNLIGASYAGKNEHQDAIRFYQEALNLQKQNFEILNNIAKSLIALEQYDEALKYLKESIKMHTNNHDAYFNIGKIYQKQNLLDLSIENYLKSIQININFPIGHYNTGIVYSQLGDFKASEFHYKKAIALNSKYTKAYNNLGSLYIKLKKFELASRNLQKAISLSPMYVEALHNIGILELEMKNYTSALSYFNKVLSLNSKFFQSSAQVLFLKKKLCDWSSFEDNQKIIKNITNSKVAVTPWQLLSLDDNPKQEYLRAQNYSQIFKNFHLKTSFQKNNKIKVGYFTPDFFLHAGMINMEGIFKYHNKSKFEIIGFDYGFKNNDDTHFRIKNYFDKFYYVHDLSDKEIAQLSIKNGIDIAIHRNGYSQNSRSNIFNYRAAPIQISFLGYPGTTCLEFIDYIIADKIVIPEENIQYYSEKIIYLPNTYYPTYDERKISKKIITREQFGIGSNTFVMCCFNNTYKISPREFDIWTRLLKKIPNSLLILLVENEEIKINLQSEIIKRNLELNKVMFFEYTDNDKHLARHQLGDLYLDTFNYNGHTSVVDSLYSGLPVVTMIGKSFSSRVGASLLSAIDMKNLITNNETDYENLILSFAKNPNKVLETKKELQFKKINSNLFDTKKYVLSLEKTFENIYHS